MVKKCGYLRINIGVEILKIVHHYTKHFTYLFCNYYYISHVDANECFHKYALYIVKRYIYIQTNMEFDCTRCKAS